MQTRAHTCKGKKKMGLEGARTCQLEGDHDSKPFRQRITEPETRCSFRRKVRDWVEEEKKQKYQKGVTAEKKRVPQPKKGI